MSSVLSFLGGIFSWIIDLGTGPMLSVIIFIVGLVFRIPLKKNFKAALMMGIGITGIMAVISNIMVPAIQPVMQAIPDKLGLSLNVVDIGWASAGVSFAWPGAFIVIPIFIALNILMISMGITRVLWVDIWAFWNALFFGGVAYVVSGSLWLAIGLVIFYMIFQMLFADWSAPKMQEFYEMPGCCWEVATCSMMQVLAPALDWVIDHIPGINKINWTPASIEKKFGFLGQSVSMGFIIGFVLGLIGAYGSVTDYLANAVMVGCAMSATMVLLPKMVSVLMEGIMPLTSSIRSFMTEKFKGKEVYISLDNATLMGHPSVIAASLISIPLVVLISAILPGNGILAVVSLATVPYWITSFAAQTKGNVFRMVLMMMIWIIPMCYIATFTAPGQTAACLQYGVAVDIINAGNQVATLCPSDPFTAIVYYVATLFA